MRYFTVIRAQPMLQERVCGPAQSPDGRRGLGCKALGPGPTPPPNCSVKEGANKEVLGILVSYRVKVKLVVSRGG